MYSPWLYKTHREYISTYVLYSYIHHASSVRLGGVVWRLRVPTKLGNLHSFYPSACTHFRDASCLAAGLSCRMLLPSILIQNVAQMSKSTKSLFFSFFISLIDLFANVSWSTKQPECLMFNWNILNLSFLRFGLVKWQSKKNTDKSLQ